MKLHTINAADRLYVIECGAGFSCYGFDVLDRKARAVAAWLYGNGQHTEEAGREWPEMGTAEHFATCDGVMDAGARYAGATGKRCPAELVPALVGLEGQRVAATVYGERIRFTVGKSTGWMPCHLQLKTARSSGGDALSVGSVTDVRRVG
jgi:hypothetical protein